MKQIFERIDMALAPMVPGGPRNLRAYLAQPGPDCEKATAAEVDVLLDLLLSPDPNNQARLRFSNLLRSWDNAQPVAWAGETRRNTADRRARIHQLLQAGVELATRIDVLLPFYPLHEPVIITRRHTDWYAPQEGVRDYYWRTYLRYLRERRRWDDDALLSFGNSTRAIVECLANPVAPAAYASRGLVMGYVQSGKTANFTGVIARAADAGYRLIIVLAGTWNILRNQTQRRFDKELLGKELLGNDDTYALHPPPDWDEFLEHGCNPVDLGHFTWQRLTRPDYDFRRLRAAIDNLEFQRSDRAQPIYAPTNLHVLPVKLLVVKKHSGILGNLTRDLTLLQTKLADLPALIIDDESDQAGLNTVAPQRQASKERSATNAAIVKLLKLFPRGQYVGYTATPYANALVDPDDPEDLFPKDFIVSLDRPGGYMGVSDFFDPTVAYADLSKEDFTLAEVAHIRRVEAKSGEDDEDLKTALRSWVLSGGIKLYRHGRDPERYTREQVQHHTMLIHTSARTHEQATLAGRLETLWDQCAFNTRRGLADLERLWDTDYAKVCAARGTSEITPRAFSVLVSYLSEAIKRIETGDKVFLVVNSERAEAPDFNSTPVWKAVIGGNKLSRGYTIEGLTVSYYRRVARTAETLMQMGRWFGFRPGYRDLVRVFLGVREGRNGETDLVALFKDVCRMEERFRDELKRYIARPDAKRITPMEIPPLIALSGTLPPVAKNKMFNAVLASKNFGGQRSMLTLTASDPTGIKENVKATTRLLTKSTVLGSMVLGGMSGEGKRMEATAMVFRTSTEELVVFLKAFHWLETDYLYPGRPADTSLQIEFLENKHHGISSWLIMAPQRKASFGDPLPIEGIGDLAVKERHRVENRGFQVFGEPVHRTIAEYLVAIEPGSANLAKPAPAIRRIRDEHQGVCLLYPVREQPGARVSIGFELLFPKNDLPFDAHITVRRAAEKTQVVIE